MMKCYKDGLQTHEAHIALGKKSSAVRKEVYLDGEITTKFTHLQCENVWTQVDAKSRSHVKNSSPLQTKSNNSIHLKPKKWLRFF